MREIKFRAWDEKEKKWIYTGLSSNVVMLLDGGDLRLYSLTEEGRMRNEPYPNPYKLVQFTGLKDKNGKEIYEGDVYRLNDGQKGVVRNFIDDTFHLKAMQFHRDEFEVIGNIYEHSDLLK